MSRMRSVSRGARRAMAVAAAAAAIAACVSSDGETVDVEADDGDTEVAITGVSADGSSSDASGASDVDEPVAEAGDGAEDEVDDEFELPANVWPAEVDPPGSKFVVTRSPDAVGDGVAPEGLTTVTARITSADGEVCEVCMWLADSSEERSTGLMGVTDLGDPVGMVFAWDDPTDGRFFMLDTPTPLSIAWFDEDGAHVGETDMEPCLTDDSAECERYGAEAPYTHAVEMFQNQLDIVGIGPGATFEIVEGSESLTCQV